MNERLLAITLSQTGTAVTGAWVVEFPFPTRLLGAKASGSNVNDTTLTVAGGATISATAFGDSGDPAYIQPDSEPDYAAEDTAYTVTLTQGATQADDPLIILFFLIGEGGTNMVGVGERIIAATLMQTGTAVTGAWTIEFPFPTRLIGLKHSGSDGGKNSTITVAGGAAIAATTIAASGNPTWTEPDSTPDYAAEDTVYTFTITQGGSPIDDPLIVALFAVGEGGSNMALMGERVIVTTLMQTGSAVTGAWVFECPFPTRFVGSKAGGSNANTTTLEVSGGATDAAVQIGDSGNPEWLTPTTEPDFVAKDTAVTLTLTQTGSRADDPMIVTVWHTGEG